MLFTRPTKAQRQAIADGELMYGLRRQFSNIKFDPATTAREKSEKLAAFVQDIAHEMRVLKSGASAHSVLDFYRRKGQETIESLSAHFCLNADKADRAEEKPFSFYPKAKHAEPCNV